MHRWVKILNEPFPSTSSPVNTVSELFLIGLFVSFFLIVFEPFGFGNIPTHLKYKIAFQFGGISFGISLIHEVLLFWVLGVKTDTPSWTLGKWILHVMVLVLFISIGNFLFNQHIGAGSYSWRSFISIAFSTLAIGIFPITVVGLMVMNKHQRRHKEEASHLHPHRSSNGTSVVSLDTQTRSSSLEIQSDRLGFLEAMENYVVVNFADEEKVKKEVLRNTLSNMENSLPESFVRCHRSYIVNLDLVESVSGNAQGLRLKVAGFESLVPVSRKYIPLLKKRLGERDFA